MECKISDLFNEGVVLVKGLPGAFSGEGGLSFQQRCVVHVLQTADRLVKYLSSVGIKPPRHVFDLVSVRDKAAVEYIVETTLQLNPRRSRHRRAERVESWGRAGACTRGFYHGISRQIPVILIKEDTDVSLADYLTDVILEVGHRLLEGGVSIRYVKVLKVRGRFVRYTSLPLRHRPRRTCGHRAAGGRQATPRRPAHHRLA